MYGKFILNKENLHVNSMKIFASNVNVKVNKSIKYIQLYKINKITYI